MQRLSTALGEAGVSSAPRGARGTPSAPLGFSHNAPRSPNGTNRAEPPREGRRENASPQSMRSRIKACVRPPFCTRLLGNLLNQFLRTDAVQSGRSDFVCDDVTVRTETHLKGSGSPFPSSPRAPFSLQPLGRPGSTTAKSMAITVWEFPL